ncbi:hypothetical protein AGMMS50267_03030 [Spirochaetia bacterium]|nr:hypothetical protein AGMMS50267_03030 [Spirochaetia bacterium]
MKKSVTFTAVSVMVLAAVLTTALAGCSPPLIDSVPLPPAYPEGTVIYTDAVPGLSVNWTRKSGTIDPNSIYPESDAIKASLAFYNVWHEFESALESRPYYLAAIAPSDLAELNASFSNRPFAVIGDRYFEREVKGGAWQAWQERKFDVWQKDSTDNKWKINNNPGNTNSGGTGKAPKVYYSRYNGTDDDRMQEYDRLVENINGIIEKLNASTFADQTSDAWLPMQTVINSMNDFVGQNAVRQGNFNDQFLRRDANGQIITNAALRAETDPVRAAGIYGMFYGFTIRPQDHLYPLGDYVASRNATFAGL